MTTSFPPWTDEHEMIRRTVRKFSEERLAPHRHEWDKAGQWPAREMFKEMAELGLLGIKVDPQYDGMGLDWWANTAFADCQHLRLKPASVHGAFARFFKLHHIFVEILLRRKPLQDP